MAEHSSTLTGKGPCPECRKNGGDRSGNNLATYDDGHAHCFACGHFVPGDGSGAKPPATPKAAPKNWKPLVGRHIALTHRGVSEETCRRFDYRCAKSGGEVFEIANYYRDGQLCGQKVRGKGKQFSTKGDMTDAPLFGQQLWKSNGGRRLVVTEGEIDAMSVYQALGEKWPVVSIPAGAKGAKAAFKSNLEFLNSYDQVVICFDNDEPGKEAAQECAQVLMPGKAQIASTPRKDANEHVMNGDVATLVTALWEAQTYRPDGIIHVKDVVISEDKSIQVCEFPWDGLNKHLYGRRYGEIVMHTSGSGMGKSTVLREMIWYDLCQGIPCGVMMLEEGVQDTLHDLMSLLLNKPIKRILAARAINSARIKSGKQALDFGVVDDLSDDEYQSARKQLNERGLFLYDHFGSLESDVLISKMEYMTTAMGCRNLYLDHVSIVISGQESGNERKDIDVLMTNLRSMVERTDCHLDAVCHLTKPDGRPFEEGGQISLRDLRGSGSLYQLSDSVLGYERNQQDPDKDIANTIMVRSLKDRFGGVTGLVSALRYSTDSGRTSEIGWGYDLDGNVTFNSLDPSDSTNTHDLLASEKDLEDTEDLL